MIKYCQILASIRNFGKVIKYFLKLYLFELMFSVLVGCPLFVDSFNSSEL